jgi:hypothetical protein
MTRNEAIRQTRQADVLQSLGFTSSEADALRRISLTLHRWAEHECNGAIQRDGDNGDGAPFWFNTHTGRKIGRVSDRERGAMKRLKAIMDTHPTMRAYLQGDPRGCALYILRPGDVPEGQDVGGYYSRGIAVY